MDFKINTFHLPKTGNKSKEYEDAYGYRLRKAKRLVVVDGASQGFDSKGWALSLVSSFKKKLPVFEKTEFENWLKKPIEKWKTSINFNNLPWNAEEKARRGAFSTLLGIDFGDAPYNHWQAVAVGDSNLFHIRKDNLIVHFPIALSKNFDSTPDLISTREDYNSKSLNNIKVCSGDCKPDDLFILATDAFSAWFLSQVETGRKPWRFLFELTELDASYMVKHKIFSDFISDLRSTSKIQNDDITVLLAQYKE